VINVNLSIIIPCFNEAENIPSLLEACSSHFKLKAIELILVNNGSTDETEAILERVAKNYAFLKVVNLHLNAGYGGGILKGLEVASNEFIGWTHADMQTDPKDVVTAFEILERNDFADNVFIKGRRYGRPLADRFFTVFMSIFETILLAKPLNDINAQPTVFHKTFFRSWVNPPVDFSLDLFSFYQAKNHNLNVFRFPVFFGPRLHGLSKWNLSAQDKYRFIKRTLEYSLKLRRDL
jgi:glycosyltransferase involved in cell wall biosynthesis